MAPSEWIKLKSQGGDAVWVNLTNVSVLPWVSRSSPLVTGVEKIDRYIKRWWAKNEVNRKMERQPPD